MPKILAFAGSTRTESFNKKLIKIGVEGARTAGAEVTLIDLRDFPMPLYDGDLEAASGIPEHGKRLKKLFVEHDGLLISSPEYNSSIPGVLKNAIDWVSRPEPNEPPLVAFGGKVAALMSASPGSERETQSIAFLSTPGIELLYSGDEIINPSCSRNSFLSRFPCSGIPLDASRSPS